MANTMITPSVIAKEALFQLENNCIAADKCHREYKKEFVKIGDTVTIRKPVKFVASDGATRSNQDVLETSTSVVIDKRKHVSWKFSTQELTLTIEEYSARYIKPAMVALANQIDVDVLTGMYQGFWNNLGTPGTTPATFAALAAVAQRMDESAVPDDGMRHLIVNPAANWSLATAFGGTGIYNPDIVKEAHRKGNIGNVANFQIWGDQNVQNHTVGTKAGTPLTAGVGVNGASTLATDGWTASSAILKKGDVFTIAGVYAVNPISRATLTYLQQFVVTANVSADGAGLATIAISPALNSGASNAAYQNISALPADNAAITVVGTASTAYPMNVAFHKNAYALVTVPLELPDSAGFKARADWNGHSLRVVKDYNIDSDEEVIRIDVMYGSKAIYPELGARLIG